MQIFEIFECSDENLPNSSYHFSIYKPVFLQILHDSLVSWKITPIYLFRSKVIAILCTKGTNQSADFGKFWVLRSKLKNFCHFWNSKSVFLQILHQSSVSWDITPLYVLLYLKFYILSTKGDYQSTNLVKFHLSGWNFSENHIKLQLKKYRRDISHDIEEWCKV